MGSKGYALLIEHGIDLARAFAEEIRSRSNFELVTAPELNILTYRFFPLSLKKQFEEESRPDNQEINVLLNKINQRIQRLQREAGKSFVSRTTLKSNDPSDGEIVVLRCVLMNPMTTIDILREILDEQEEIYQRAFGQSPRGFKP